MTFAALIPLLISAAGGWLLRHFGFGTSILSGLGSLLGRAAGPNPLAPPPAKPSVAPAHPVLSDAVNAAIVQAVNDVTTGRVSGLKSELQSIAEAAAAKALADLSKPKP